MPPPNQNSNLKQTPIPTNHKLFDPWNSASSGHQVSDSTPGTAWQRTREAKLAQQFRSGDCTINSLVYDSGKRIYEKGEWEWDWGGDARGRGGDGRSKRGSGVVEGDSKQRDIRFMMRAGKAGGVKGSVGKEVKEDSAQSQMPTTNANCKQHANKPTIDTCSAPTEQFLDLTPGAVGSPLPVTSNPIPEPQPNHSNIHPESTILRNATVYINGQTTPLISDHKLKQLLVSHGATLALGISRRVTHMIIGKPNAGPGRGAGGGLAAGKIQKEAKRGGWRGMRIVGVEWALESIKAGKRLPETRFVVNLSGQRSVLGFM
ncbi:hypothetical protein BJY04DRAFT_223443 [Aspergillus karnatakaensis]|uniref:uncharacterized protein n=1 Tax=Aspergillus karnatakaensis TaxID=1810916 RepID=UPI003CCD181E